MGARWTMDDLNKLAQKRQGAVAVTPAKGWGAKRYSLIIGIDTGTNTGFAIWNRDTQRFDEISTVAIHKALFKVKELHDAGNSLFVRVEDARKRTWFGTDEKSIQAKKMNVGYVKRDATVWEDFLTDTNIPFEMVAPAANKTKLSKEQFRTTTGYNGLTSEHSRDAGMLVYKYQ